jgi:hypothetical protein
MEKYMIKFTNNLKQILLEDIYGNKAIVYHRTNVKNLIDKIYDKGFKPSEGGLYGSGFYSTYKLESQISKSMAINYGPIIIKFAVLSLDNFLFLDYDEFIKSPVFKKINSSKNTFVQDQLEYFGFNKLKKIELKNEYDYSSDIIKFIYDRFKTVINKLIDGVVFTGRNDGKVLLSYNLDLLVPLSFTTNDGKDWKKTNKENTKYLQKVFSRKEKIIGGKKVKEIQKNHWIYKADISLDSKYDTNFYTNNIFNWFDGTWHDGTWEDGTWEKGTWEKGTWEKGYWYNGDWEDGTWKNGYWGYGTWYKGKFLGGIWETGDWWNGTWKGKFWRGGNWLDGHWYKGTWEGGTWEKGTWHDGDWILGTWRNGDWLKGTWHSGIWKSGTWHNGTWKGGDWLGGNWLGGKDALGDYHKKGDSPDKWHENHWIYKGKLSSDAKFVIKNGIYPHWFYGTLEDGIWKDGVWIFGTCKNTLWKDGLWEIGIWEGGTWEDGYWSTGDWLSGTWKNGSFVGGVWHDGTWEKGTWKNGTWLDGTWLDGIWHNGKWKGGYDKFGDFHKENDSPREWLLKDHWFYKGDRLGKYIVNNGKIDWYDGVWNDGVWNGGTWWKGTWLGGTWKSGKWLGGYDKNGKYHKKGDSPNKWK